MSEYDEYSDKQMLHRIERLEYHINLHLRKAGELGIRLAAAMSQPQELPRGRSIGEYIQDITEQVDEYMKGVVRMENLYEDMRTEMVSRKVRTPLRKRDLDVVHQYRQYDENKKVWA